MYIMCCIKHFETLFSMKNGTVMNILLFETNLKVYVRLTICLI